MVITQHCNVCGRLVRLKVLILALLVILSMHMISTCQHVFCFSTFLIVRCLQTLCALLRAIFQKKLVDMSFDVIDVLIGFDSAECQMRVGPYQ